VAFPLRRRLSDRFCRAGLLRWVATKVLTRRRLASMLAGQSTERTSRPESWADAIRGDDAGLRRKSALDRADAHQVLWKFSL
jgi:hypothetical protein